MIVMSINKLIDGDFSKIHLAISERVCDAARTLAALSSILPSLISDAESGTAIQIAFSKAIYSIVHIITSALDIISVILTFLDDLIGNRLVWTSGSEFPIFTLVFTILNIFIDWIRMMLQGFVALDGHGFTTSMPLYVGDTGNPTTTTPESGFARIIGYVVDDDTIYFDPSKVWVDIAG